MNSRPTAGGCTSRSRLTRATCGSWTFAGSWIGVSPRRSRSSALPDHVVGRMLKQALRLAVARHPVRDRPRHFRATRVDLEQLELRCRERAQRLMDLLLPVEQDTRVVDARAHAAHRLSRPTRIYAVDLMAAPAAQLLEPGNAHAHDGVV